MFASKLALLAIAASYVPGAVAQAYWEEGQTNTTMCSWAQLRATVVRDTVYMDGGDLSWLPGFANGTYGAVVLDNNPLGLMWYLNFSNAFNVTSNATSVMGSFQKVGGASTNLAPNYYDGALLGNDEEFFLYGGLLADTDAFSPPADNQVGVYYKFQYGANKGSFQTSFSSATLPSGLTRYLAYGGAANAPSENKAWYFSGLESPTGGPIYTVSGNESIEANNVSNTLITLDLSTQYSEKWSNSSLPSTVQGRANPELVWVPVGSQGILVALGGVVYPDFADGSYTSANATGSEEISPGFMQNINIYDIASGTWYTQPTTGGPGQTTRGCAVVAPAQDGSSFNIYYYGGYDGIDETQGIRDDTWILSLPSFMWMKINSGNGAHGRAGHKCVMPYPDQMFAIGGYTNLSGSSPTCISDGIVQVMNLTTGQWMSGYDPAKYHSYGVPEMIYLMIGGGATGGATSTTPSPTWAATGLASVFQTAYATSKITTYYPYGSANANNTNPDYNKSGGSGVPSYLGPVLGVVLGLLLITFLVLGWMLYRRRQYLKRTAGTSTADTEEVNGGRIAQWLRGTQGQQASDIKAPTSTTEETAPMSPEMEHLQAHSMSPQPFASYEMPDTQVTRVELMDTSPRAELHDIPMSPGQILEKHFAPGGGSASMSSPSYYSGMTQTDHMSTVSHSTADAYNGSNLPPLPEQSPYQHLQQQQQPHSPHTPHTPVRPDSPPLGDLGAGAGAAAAVGSHAQSPSPTQGRRVESGMSNLSERDRAHLRQISDTTISSVRSGGNNASNNNNNNNNQDDALITDHMMMSPTAPSPAYVTPQQSASAAVSPPGAGIEAQDYMSARRIGNMSPLTPSGGGGGSSASQNGNNGSPLRRSIFRESREDMGADREEGEDGPGIAR